MKEYKVEIIKQNERRILAKNIKELFTHLGDVHIKDIILISELRIIPRSEWVVEIL